MPRGPKRRKGPCWGERKAARRVTKAEGDLWKNWPRRKPWQGLNLTIVWRVNWAKLRLDCGPGIKRVVTGKTPHEAKKLGQMVWRTVSMMGQKRRRNWRGSRYDKGARLGHKAFFRWARKFAEEGINAVPSKVGLWAIVRGV